MLETPDSIITELHEINRLVELAREQLNDAEIKYSKLKLEADKTEAKTLLTAQGTVVDRQAIAKIKAGEELLAAEIAKAEVNRWRTQIDVLKLRQSNAQTRSNLVMMLYRTAGVGER